jgi:hypothetical protein
MEGIINKIIITVGDDSNKKEGFKIVESDENEDNAMTDECEI